MNLTFLGTSAGTPSRTRSVSAVALQLPERGEWWLFDCGEATQHQILRCSHLRLSQLSRIFITHLHGDHLYGLPGLLASRGLGGGAGGSAPPLALYGPPGVEEFVRVALGVGGGRVDAAVTIVTEPKELLVTGGFTVACAKLRHRVPCWGYAVTEEDQPGRFDVETARALGVAPGPLFGRLKAGETITLADGRTVRGADLSGPTRRGRKVVVCGDTIATPTAVELARDADLLVHEATYLQADLSLAERALHSTSTMAAQVARAANVGRLALTHVSPRYEGDGSGRLLSLLAEARAVFPETLLAHDLLQVSVPRRAALTAPNPGTPA